MKYKVIVVGKLQFKNARSLQQALKTFLHQNEVLFRNQILFKAEDVFDEENHCLTIERTVRQHIDKKWIRNTISILTNAADFAMAGSIGLWFISEEKAIEYRLIEPDNDKSAVVAFHKGRKIIAEDGPTTQAIDSLNKAIKKFERHAAAYERRGFVNHQLSNIEDAFYDYNKSISINQINPNAYFGRALIHATKGKYEEAIEDLVKTTNTSVGLQPIYWRARRLKGDCHLRLSQYNEAAKEYELFTKRKFSDSDPNYTKLQDAYFNFGKALVKIGKPSEALEAFSKAKELGDDRQKLSFTSEEWEKYNKLASNAV